MPAYDGIDDLQQAISHGGAQVFDVAPTVLRHILTKRLWADRLDQHKQPFLSFEAFVAAPLWEGLQSSLDDLLLYCRKRKDVQELIRAEVGAAPQHVGRGHRSGNANPNSGMTATYALRRLKRDRPDLADKVVSGELSANAASVEAGFRKKPTPLEQIQKLWTRLSAEERNRHLDWTLKHCATCGREGKWIAADGKDRPDGSWCDACCVEGRRSLAEPDTQQLAFFP